MIDQVDSGLRRELAAPVGSGYAQVLAGYTGKTGGFARLEAGWHPASSIALFGYGETSQRLGASAGVGARFSW